MKKILVLLAWISIMAGCNQNAGLSNVLDAVQVSNVTSISSTQDLVSLSLDSWDSGATIYYAIGVDNNGGVSGDTQQSVVETNNVLTITWQNAGAFTGTSVLPGSGYSAPLTVSVTAYNYTTNPSTITSYGNTIYAWATRPGWTDSLVTYVGF
jgi:hypothetical protein